MSNYSDQHDPRISGADFETDADIVCPRCGFNLDTDEAPPLPNDKDIAEWKAALEQGKWPTITGQIVLLNALVEARRVNERLYNFLRWHWQNSEDGRAFCNFCNGIGPTHATVNHKHDCILFILPENRSKI